MFLELALPLLKSDETREFRAGAAMSLQILEVKQLEVERQIIEGVIPVLVDKVYGQLTLVDEELQAKVITQSSTR